MKSYLVIPFCLFAFATILACDSEQDHYSGLSELVAERNEARRTISNKNLRKKAASDQPESPPETKHDIRDVIGKNGGAKETAGGILYEKKIEIIDSQSGMPLSKGVAFLDKKGRIVKIKLVKN